MSQSETDEKFQAEVEAELEGNLSASASFDASIKSDDDFAAPEYDVELYTPSSPFHINDEFILPDIMEENEETELEDDGNERPELEKPGTEELNQTSSTLETETSFSEEVLGILERNGSLRMASSEQCSSPPILPNSPPPGPLLISDAKTPLASIPLRKTAKSSHPTPLSFKAEASYRHSMAGAVEDIPPPLPSTQPPGKLMSPRHSLFMDLADINGGYQPTQLDLSQIVPQMSRIREAPEEVKRTNKENGTNSLNKECDKNMKTNLASLIPPPLAQEESSQTRERPESYYLRTFEPPKEFSDSGFQDTDNTADNSNSRSPRVAAPEQQPEVVMSSSVKVSSMTTTQAWVQQIDSSTTFTSDDQMTEHSGSIGITLETSNDVVVSLTLKNMLPVMKYVPVI